MKGTTRSYMVRRGRRYLIERSKTGVFLRWIPVGLAALKKKKKTKKTKKGRK